MSGPGPEGDIAARFGHVRYTPNSGQTQSQSVCPLSANCVISRRTKQPLFDHLVSEQLD
jgi:hypothetical protein